MMIDTESEEGRALVALAKFGRAVLDMEWGCSYCDVDAFLIKAGHRHGLLYMSGVESDLAKLPEGI